MLEYRYFYQELLGADVTLVLVIETPPPRDKAWLTAFLRSLGVTLAWKEPAGIRLMTDATIPGSLRGLIVPAV